MCWERGDIFSWCNIKSWLYDGHYKGFLIFLSRPACSFWWRSKTAWWVVGVGACLCEVDRIFLDTRHRLLCRGPPFSSSLCEYPNFCDQLQTICYGILTRVRRTSYLCSPGSFGELASSLNSCNSSLCFNFSVYMLLKLCQGTEKCFFRLRRPVATLRGTKELYLSVALPILQKRFRTSFETPIPMWTLWNASSSGMPSSWR